jgi:hypothetical protein
MIFIKKLLTVPYVFAKISITQQRRYNMDHHTRRTSKVTAPLSAKMVGMIAKRNKQYDDSVLQFLTSAGSRKMAIKDMIGRAGVYGTTEKNLTAACIRLREAKKISGSASKGWQIA